MTRLRVLICSLGVCALALALAAGSAVLLPAEAQAFTCFCPIGYSTAPEWGAGTSCAAAIADFEANAYATAENNCADISSEICATQAPVNNGCWVDAQGVYHVDGTIRYKCLKCVSP